MAATVDEGRALFSRNCASCHGSDGRGGERGPSITARNLDTRTDLPDLIRKGLPARGMPGVAVSNEEAQSLALFLKTLARPETAPSTAKGRGPTFAEIATPPSGSWPTYHGRLDGNRYSSLKQIDRKNVGQLRMQWMYSIPGAGRLQVTPVVFDGVMFVTAPNEAIALDASTGQQIWNFRRKRTEGVAGDAGSGINRGVAILNDSVFLVTDNAHIIALDRATGRLRWETEMADPKENYGATSAPLIAGDLVISGVSGGDEGIRGFVAAFRASDGKEVWRTWAIPKRGEPLADTWQGKDLENGCGATWLTGTYDPSSELVYWGTGNPCPDYNGDERKGDNLYTDSVLALERSTGKLRWYFQYTPHDLNDWDAEQTPMLVDANWNGSPRKLLVQANRNGYLYVLDRTNGKMLLGKPFIRNLNWSSGLTESGRPILVPGMQPTPEGTKICPAVEGATNWMSTAYHPWTSLLYVQALESCSIFRKAPDTWKAGESFYGGNTRRPPGEKGQKFLRAIDIQTGKLAWELAQEGPGDGWGGVLATAGDLVFFGHDSGDFAAADARNGTLLWRFHANQRWKASPMTFTANGKQLIAVAGSGSIAVFGLP